MITLYYLQITESSSEVVPKMESADSVAEEGVSDLQKEIDNVITGTLKTLLQVRLGYPTFSCFPNLV